MVCEQSSAAVIDQHPVVVQQIRAVLLCVLGDDPDQAAVSLGCDVSFRISRHWLIIDCCNTNTPARYHGGDCEPAGRVAILTDMVPPVAR